MSIQLTTVRATLGTLGSVLLIGTVMGSCAPGGQGDSAGGAWTPHLQRVDQALAVPDISAAERAWHEAYLQALGSRCWEGMVEVGDAALRIGAAAKGRKVAEPRARQAYLAALFRARRQGSVDGVLRTAEAFAALGDRQVVEQSLHMAKDLAEHRGDPRARERVAAFRDRWTGQSLMAGRPSFDPVPPPFPDEIAGP